MVGLRQAKPSTGSVQASVLHHLFWPSGTLSLTNNARNSTSWLLGCLPLGVSYIDILRRDTPDILITYPTRGPECCGGDEYQCRRLIPRVLRTRADFARGNRQECSENKNGPREYKIRAVLVWPCVTRASFEI